MAEGELKGFVFFRSFYEALKGLPDDLRGRVVDGLCAYAFEGVEPSGDPLAESLFLLMKPNVDASLKRYRTSQQNGAKGGSARVNHAAKRAVSDMNGKTNPITTEKQPEDQPESKRTASEIQPEGQPEVRQTVSKKQPEKGEGKRKGKGEGAAGEIETAKESGKEREGANERETEGDAAAVADAFAACGMPLKAHQMREAETFLAMGMPPELLAEAARRAVDAGAARWNYAKGILNKWQRQGLTTLAAVHADDLAFRQRQGRRAPPVWKTPLTESQQAPIYVGRIYSAEELAAEDPWKMS